MRIMPTHRISLLQFCAGNYLIELQIDTCAVHCCTAERRIRCCSYLLIYTDMSAKLN